MKRARGSRFTVRGGTAAIVIALLSVAAGFNPPAAAQIGGLKPAATQEPASGTSLADVWRRLFRPTNSHAAAARGTQQFDTKKFAEAAKSFAAADQLEPGPKSAFNLGTAQIAAGKNSEGSASLARAIHDSSLRPDALYNRGNSALASKAFEYAIRDYVETLKLRPRDAAAKRNLEIALKRLDEMQKSAGSGGNENQKPQQQQSKNQQSAPAAGQQKQQTKQQGDAEALLRAVQQQEQEELERMKRARAANARVGW